MFKDIKLGFKMVKYGIQSKQMIISGVVFFGLGLIFLITGNIMQPLIGMMYLMMCFSFFTQATTSLTLSSCIASSAVKKRLALKVPVVINGLGSLVGYLAGFIVLVLKYYVISPNSGVPTSEISTVLIVAGILSLVVQIYMMIAYKVFFIISLMVFFVCFFPLYGLMNYFTAKVGELNVSLGAAAGIGIVVVLIGTVLTYFVGKALYRRPIDSWYYKRSIANATK